MDFNEFDADDAKRELARQDRTMQCLQCDHHWNKYQQGTAFCPNCSSTEVMTETEYLEAHSEDDLD